MEFWNDLRLLILYFSLVLIVVICTLEPDIDIHNNPVIAHSIHTGAASYLLSAIDVQAWNLQKMLYPKQTQNINVQLLGWLLTTRRRCKTCEARSAHNDFIFSRLLK